MNTNTNTNTRLTLSQRLDNFIDLHAGQLRAMGLPRRLWPALWGKMEAAHMEQQQSHQHASQHDPEFRAMMSAALNDRPFELHVSDDSNSDSNCTNAVELRVSRDLTPPQALIVYRHNWTFSTRDEAKSHLDASVDLRRVLSRMLESVQVMNMASGGLEGGTSNPIVNQHVDAALDSQTILSNLYKIAFQFQITSRNARDNFNTTTTKNYYAVSTDAFSPAVIPYAKDSTPLFTAKVFIYSSRSTDHMSQQEQQKEEAFTILFPTVLPSDFEDEERDSLNEVVIKAGTKVTRSELTSAPDYSSPEYWLHHYRTGAANRVYEWFLPWRAIAESVRAALNSPSPEFPADSKAPATAGVVLNVGSGTSRAGQELLLDGTAAHVVSLDVSLNALDATRRRSGVGGGAGGSRTGLGGTEDLLLLDVTTPTTPLRGDSNSSLIDWALDKGTTDGLLYSSPSSISTAAASRAWEAVARCGAKVLVWVSLGTPEGRVALIEDEIGKGVWGVDQCFEVELPSGASGMSDEHGGGKIDCCFVYVCRVKNTPMEKMHR